MSEKSHDKAHELLMQLIGSNAVTIPSGFSGDAGEVKAKNALDFLSALYSGLRSMYEGGEK